jgi:HlyD family secretion protein
MLNNPNSDQLHLVQGNEFLPSISSWTTIGRVFLVGTFSAAVALAAFLNYSVTVKAPANIRPLGELRIVQAASEGVVKSIEVKENQVVRKGDAIAIIDDSQLQTKKSQLQGNIQQSHLQLAQIDAQINSLDTQITAETRLMNRTVASAQADLGLQQRDHKDRQITTQTQVEEASAALELAREEMNRYQQLANTGAIAELQVKEKEQAFIAAQARLKGAEASLNPSAAPVAIATERIAQERARGEATLATLNKERKNLQSAQIEIQNQISRDVRELQQIGIELSKTFILAPESGIILKLDLRNASQVVRPGEAIAQIAPSNAPLVVKARVEAQNIDKVKPSQKVQMQVSACPYPDYGTLKGTVRTVAPDALPSASNEAGASAAHPSYEVIIQPQTRFVGNEDRQCRLQSGMEGRADIISRQETVLKFILRKARVLTDL